MIVWIGQGIPQPVTYTNRAYANPHTSTIAYFLTVLFRRSFIYGLLLGDSLVDGILKQGVGNDTETKEGEQQVDQTAVVVLAGDLVLLVTVLVCPDEAVNATGDEGEKEAGAAALVAVLLAEHIEFIGQVDVPENAVNTAGDDGQNDGLDQISGLDLGCDVSIDVATLGLLMLQGNTATNADHGLLGQNLLAAVGAELLTRILGHTAVQTYSLIVIHRLSAISAKHEKPPKKYIIPFRVF